MKLKDLVISPCNVRQPHDDDDVGLLAESIKENHLISKLILRKGKKDKYEVVAGQRRFKAMMKAFGEDYDLKDSDYVLNEDMSDDNAFLMSLEENQQRLGLTPMELCQAALKLNQMGLKDKDVANKLNVTAHRLKRIQTLQQDARKMPEAARAELNKTVEESKFTDAHWDKLRTIEKPDVVKDAVDYIISHEAPARDVPGIVMGVERKYEASEGAEKSDTGGKASSAPTQEPDTGTAVYEHKGELTLVEKDGKMSFMVQGKGEDEEVPVDHYLEYLRRPDKFRCQVSLKLKFFPS
jgi:ParB family chromosome partitioning protein